jgi:hypothetical protein
MLTSSLEAEPGRKYLVPAIYVAAVSFFPLARYFL